MITMDILSGTVPPDILRDVTVRGSYQTIPNRKKYELDQG
jgi:hypothetical protein